MNELDYEAIAEKLVWNTLDMDWQDYVTDMELQETIDIMATELERAEENGLINLMAYLRFITETNCTKISR